MEELEGLVQEMMDNQTPETEIVDFVKTYKEKKKKKLEEQESGNQQSSVEDVNAELETAASDQGVVQPQETQTTDTELPSEDISSDSQGPSLGSLLKAGLTQLTNPIAAAVANPIADYARSVYDEWQQGKEDEKQTRRSKKEYVDQSTSFDQELDKAFGEDPTLFGQIIENPSDLSLQDREVSNAGSPDEYLLEVVKKQMGGFGLFGKDNEFRQNNYPDLTNDDFDELVENKFYSKLDEYKQNKSNETALKKASGTENIRQWQDDNRATMINGYSDINYDIAQQVEKLNHSDLTEEEWDIENKRLLDLKSEKGDGTSMMYNLGTGQLVTARGNEDNESVVPLNLKEKQAEWKSAIGLLEPDSQLDYLRNEFESSALTYSGHEDYLDTEVDVTVSTPGSNEDGFQGPETTDKKVTIRQILQEEKGTLWGEKARKELALEERYDIKSIEKLTTPDGKTLTGNDIQTFVDVTAEDKLEYTREYEALKGMYLLNEGLDDIQKPDYVGIIPKNFSALKQSGKKLIEPWAGDYYTTNLIGSTGRENITATDAVYDNLGIEKTKSEQEQTEQSINEMVNDGLLGMNKMLVEFAGINKAMAGVGLAQKISGVHKLLTSGKWVKNGKVISDAAMKSRAAAKGLTVEAYASQLGRLSNVKKLKAVKGGYEGYKFIPATNGSKALDVLFGGLVEGAKFEAFTQFDITKLEMKPEAGERFGFAEGFGFGMAGRIVAPLSPFLQKKGFLKDVDKTILGKKFGVNSRKLFETFVTQPASFVVGSNVAGVMDNLVQDALGNESFKNFIDEKYGDHDQLGKDLISEYLIGLGLGGIHFKGFNDYKSKAGLLRGRNKQLDLMRRTAELADLTIEEKNNIFDPTVQEKLHNNLSNENLTEFYNHYEMYDMFSRRYLGAQRAEGYLDPSRADELVKQDHKEFLKEESEAGNEVTIEVVNNNKLKFGQKGIDPNRRAEIVDSPDGKGKTIRYNAERYTPDVMAHEVHHYYTEELFGRDAVFKSEFMNELNNTASKIKLGRLITESEAKELGNEGLTGKKINLSQAIKLEKFDLTSARNNSKISQWELFAHVAEQIGNKNNYLDIKKSEGFEGLKTLLSTLGKRSGKKLNLSTQGDIVEWFSKYSENVKKGKSNIELFSELREVVDVEATRINKEQRELFDREGATTLQSRDLVKEKQELIEVNKELFRTKPGGWERVKDTNVKKIKELNKNIEISERNAKNIDIYQKSEPGDVSRTRAENTLINDNMGTVSKFIDAEFKQGLDVSRSEFEAETMVQVVKIMNRYDAKTGVPFGAYLKQSLGGKHTKSGFSQLGNILRATQAGRTTEVAMSEAGVDAETLQIADTSPELSRSGPKGPKGRELVRDLNIPEDVISKAEERLSGLDVTKITYKTLKDLAPEYTNELLGVEPKAGNLGKGSVSNAQKWFSKDSNARLFIDALPEGTVEMEGAPESIKGTATGVQNVLLNSFYSKGTRVKTGAGNPIQIKNSKITPRDVKAFFGVRPDGTFIELKNDRGLSQKVKAAVDQLGKAWSNQVAREYLKNNSPQFELSTSVENLMNQVQAGKSEALASKDLGRQSIDTQKEVFRGVISPEFASIFNANISGYGKTDKAVIESFRQYFKDKDIGLKLETSTGKPITKNMLLANIANQLSGSLKLQGYKPNNIAIKIGNRILKSNEYSAVEARNGLQPLGNPFGNKAGIMRGREVEFLLAEKLNARHGSGFAEAFLKSGATTGSGLGPYKGSDVTVKGLHDLIFGKESGGARPSYFVTAGDYVANVSEPISKKVKKKWGGKKPSTYVTDRAKMMDKWVNGTLNPKEAHEIGEQNKDVLREVVEILNEAYEKGSITHEHVRAFTQLHSASMVGLIKSSASLAMLPKGNPKAFIKQYGKGGDKYGRWVLEHTTPAKEISTLIYDYITTPEASRKTQLKGWVKNALDNYHTTLIPKNLDVMVNKIYQESLPPETLFDGRSNIILDRYHSDAFGKGFDIPLYDFVRDITYDKMPGISQVETVQAGKRLREYREALFPKGYKEALASKDLGKAIRDADKAFALGRKKNKKTQGMATFDFDETLIVDGENFVVAKRGKETVKISSGNWPIEGPKYAERGFEFDFSDFVNVRGGKEGPLLQKMKNLIGKHGPKDVFVLTARMQDAAGPIHQWLKTKGVDIPLENITGLGKSQGEAKALWMLEKFAEGYNDMYFVDDALPNVEAVKKVLDQLDIKSKVQQALASKDLSQGVNDVMKHSLDIAPEKTFSKAEAKVRGADIKRRRVFMTDSAADLELLLEPLYGKGKKGVENQKWFNENFMKPFERGYNDLNNAKQKAANQYLSLRKQNKETVKSLDKEVGETGFTNDMAVRIYNWNKSGMKIPDLAKATETKLVEHVRNNPKLQAYAENVARIVEVKEPSISWWAETIASEVGGLGEGVSRKKHLAEWIEAKNEIFSEENLNKMESKLGSNWRKNLEEMFERMETGQTRRADLGSAGNKIMNYLNGSVGTIMNFNTRSATLQLLSTVNFVNHSFNNPLAASKAFANQPQYWKDFMTIMNSDMLKQRRAGLEINVTEAELAAAASKSRNPSKAVIAKILKAGYLPTKIADSFAIASGGATYYRNAINKYMKEGLSKAEAEKKAFVDFQAVAERTQQSSRPDLLSAQQVSWGGRIVLPFANTPMQMNRIMMKELLDIKNGRYKGFAGDGSFTNKLSKVGYYGFVQSAIFAGLQSGLFALMANSDDDELKAEKEIYAINTMADSFLRGMGIPGAVLSGIKNGILEFQKQNDKGWGADYSEVGEDLLNVSPTIGSKFGKFDAAGNTYKYNKKEILKEGLTLDGPALEGLTMLTEGLLNVPVNRAHRKITNIQAALDDQNEAWQRVLVGLGWSKWDVGIGQREKAEEKEEKDAQKKIDKENKKVEDRKKKEEEKKQEQKKKEEQGIKEVRCSGIKSNNKRCKIMIETKADRVLCVYHKSK